MTTIAYKNGIIAYDSMSTRGDLITNRTSDKHLKVSGIHFFLCGAQSDYDDLICAWFGQDRVKTIPECEALVVDESGTVWDCACNEENIFWKARIGYAQIYAIGSGRSCAFSAMDCGKDARGAVAIAAGRDVCTGGEIRTFSVFSPQVNPESQQTCEICGEALGIFDFKGSVHI